MWAGGVRGVWPTAYGGGDKYLLKTPKNWQFFLQREGWGHRGHQHCPNVCLSVWSYAAQTMPSNVPIFGMQIGTIKETGPNRAEFFWIKINCFLCTFLIAPPLYLS